MTSAASRSTILALNCGSSSLKFGLYRVEGSIPNALLSGEVESIGDTQGKFWAKDANDKLLVSESANFPSQQHAVARIAAFLADRKEPQPIRDWASRGAQWAKSSAAIAWSTKWCCGNSKRQPPSLRCTILRRCRSFASRRSTSRSCRRWPALTRRFTLGCQMSRAPCRYP